MDDNDNTAMPTCRGLWQHAHGPLICSCCGACLHHAPAAHTCCSNTPTLTMHEQYSEWLLCTHTASSAAQLTFTGRICVLYYTQTRRAGAPQPSQQGGLLWHTPGARVAVSAAIPAAISAAVPATPTQHQHSRRQGAFPSAHHTQQQRRESGRPQSSTR